MSANRCGGWLKQALWRFSSDERGATAIEYGLIVGLIVVALIGTLTALGGQMSDMFTSVAGTIAAQAAKI